MWAARDGARGKRMNLEEPGIGSVRPGSNRCVFLPGAPPDLRGIIAGGGILKMDWRFNNRAASSLLPSAHWKSQQAVRESRQIRSKCAANSAENLVYIYDSIAYTRENEGTPRFLHLPDSLFGREAVLLFLQWHSERGGLRYNFVGRGAGGIRTARYTRGIGQFECALPEFPGTGLFVWDPRQTHFPFHRLVPVRGEFVASNHFPATSHDSLP